MGAGLTALGTVAAIVTVVIVVVGGVLSPSGAAGWKLHRHLPWHPRHTKTVTATATATVTATPTLPRPTATVTRTAPGGPTTHPTTPTSSPTAPSSSPTGPVTTPTSPTSTGTPPASDSPGIGIYMSGNNAGLDSYTAGWKKQPNVASFYLNWNSNVPALMKTYAGQGREIQASLSTSISAGSYVTWAAIAKGTYDDHIISTVKALDALGSRVLLSLDVEPDGQYQGGTGVAQGQTPAQYVAAANHVADLIHANSTHVESLVWLAGFKSAAVSASFLPAHSKIDNIGWDPYMTGSYSSNETPTQLFSTFIKTVLVPNGYADVPRHILETGVKTDAQSNGQTFSSATQSNFMKGIPVAMTADDIESVVWFRANSGAHDYIPTDSSVDKSFATMVASLLG